MVNSIPFDPGLTLGNILDHNRIISLQKIAEAQKPLTLANDKLNALITQNYKADAIYKQMVNMHISEKDLEEIGTHIQELRDAMIDAATELGKITIETERNVMALKLAGKQTKTTKNLESPIDYKMCEIAKFPAAFDTIKFDVQFHHMEKNEDASEAHARSISASVGGFYKDATTNLSASASVAVNTAALKQSTNHRLEGTIVICADCTHRQADIIDPFIIDPVKAVAAWNGTFPEDKIKIDPMSIIEAALPSSKEEGENEEEPKEEPAIHLLSGCSKGSSFVGMVHILQVETSKSTQKSASVAAAIQSSIEADMGTYALAGGFGLSTSVGSTAKSLLSSSELQNHVSLVCEGSVPKIATEKVTTTVMDMKPDPKQVMGNLSAIMGSSDSAVDDSMSAMAGLSKRGKQANNLNGEYLANTVTNLGKLQDENNQVINTNSMLNAFTDFCREAISGEGGVPINFFIKRITKVNVAKAYIGKFYPNGVAGGQGLRGQLGQEEKKE